MKVVTVGGAMIDSIAIIDDDRIERMAMRNAERAYLLIEEGRKVEAREISQHCGGGGVNTAVALARLGYDAATVLKLGRDDRAEVILRRLTDEGVSTRWVMRDAGAATGASSILAAHDRDAAIFTFRGANTLLRPEELKPDMVSADLVYIAGLSNEAAECFPPLIEMAVAAGAKVATNPGIRQLTRRTGPFLEQLKNIHILSVNRAEAAALTPHLVDRYGEGGAPLKAPGGAQTPDLALVGFSGGGFDMSLAKFFAALRDCGVACALITDGARGAYAAHGDKIYYAPARKAEVVGTAGAGDSFAATFSAWFCETGDVPAALAAAAHNAASVVGHVDTQTGLLTREALTSALAASGVDKGAMEWDASPEQLR